MRAAVFYGAGDLRIETRGDPSPRQGEVVIKVLACGVCGTDAHEYAAGPVMYPVTRRHEVTGHLGPLVPGHEFAGTVVALGPGVEDLAPGELVAGAAPLLCGSCRWCRSGRSNLCAGYATVGLHRDGALAQYCALPAESCLPIRDGGLGPDALALAQPTAIAVHARARSRVAAGESALVIGVGGVGAFLTLALASASVPVWAVDLDERRLAAAGALGARGTLIAPESQALGEALGDQGFLPDVIFEASGTRAGLDSAFQVAKRGTRIVVVGLQGEGATFDARSLAVDEVEIIGTNAFARALDLPEAVRLLAEDPQRLRALAPTALPLSETVEGALAPMARGAPLQVKTLIDPWSKRPRPTRMTPS